MSAQIQINPEFRGTTRILINNAVPANGTILYVANGVICAVTPPVDGTNKALCIANNVPAWNPINVSTGTDYLAITLQRVQNAPTFPTAQYNPGQESGGVAGGMDLVFVPSPSFASTLATANSFVSDLTTHGKYTLGV